MDEASLTSEDWCPRNLNGTRLNLWKYPWGCKEETVDKIQSELSYSFKNCTKMYTDTSLIISWDLSTIISPEILSRYSSISGNYQYSLLSFYLWRNIDFMEMMSMAAITIHTTINLEQVNSFLDALLGFFEKKSRITFLG